MRTDSLIASIKCVGAPFWIERGGPIPWPPGSPDLMAFDFCIRSYLKGLVYATPVNNNNIELDKIERLICGPMCIKKFLLVGIFIIKSAWKSHPHIFGYLVHLWSYYMPLRYLNFFSRLCIMVVFEAYHALKLNLR